MEARDVIMSWLEQGNNFLRVTASSPFSPSTRHGRANLRDVALIENEALNELASFVNQRLSRNWDTRHVKHVLKRYLTDYHSTAEVAANPDFLLDEKDELRGLQTVKDKLDTKCRHFQRLQLLHDNVAIATKEREKWNNRKSQENQYVKLHFDLTETQRSEGEKEVVPESERSENSDKDKRGRQLRLEQREEKESNKDQQEDKSKRKSVKVAMITQPKQKKTKKQESKSKDVVLVLLTSDEEEENEDFPVRRRSTRAKKRSTWSEDESTWNKRKIRGVEAASEKNGKADVTPTQTTQAASSSVPQTSQDSSLNGENTPSGNTYNRDKNKLKTVHKVAPASKPTQPSAPSSNQVQRPEARRRQRQAVKNVAPPLTKHSSNPTPKSIQGTAVPESLRSAIAQVVSQRQQLLSRQAEPKRRRSLSESDYGLSDIDIPSVDPKPSAPRSALHSLKPTDPPRCSRYEVGPSVGLLPPLIDKPKAFRDKANLARKRTLLRAKELAFEQLKWQRENEFQQLELDLLRREMEVHENFAQQELKLKRKCVRADIIQPMIAAGASVADIVERLSFL